MALTRTYALMAFAAAAVFALAAVLFITTSRAPSFKSCWPEDVTRVWVGPELWANRLQDWRVSGGRLECTEGAVWRPMRTVHLLTRQVGPGGGSLIMNVRLGLAGSGQTAPAGAAAGFLVGAGPDLDHRAAALIHHSAGPGAGLFAGVDGEGRLFFRDFAKPLREQAVGKDTSPAGHLLCRHGDRATLGDLHLELRAVPSGESLLLRLSATETTSGRKIGPLDLRDVPPHRLTGSLALVSHPGASEPGARFWFEGWHVAGSRLEAHDDRTAGPVLSTQYTLSRGVLTMTAQLMPLGAADTQSVRLEVHRKEAWETAATAAIVAPGWTATFRVDGWDDTQDVPFRVVYDLKTAAGRTQKHAWSGTVRRDPKEKETVVLAAFTGNHNTAQAGVDHGAYHWDVEHLWFPHNDIMAHVAAHEPDLLFFSGDQVYEGGSPTAAQSAPLDKACLDYLYKWYLWCWAFRNLTREIPCIAIPDDHDVFQGNLWGSGGRHADQLDLGGYTMPPEFVRMVERTQTSNLPDPFDPAPVEQGIGVYYCSLEWGRISFAVLEDRKFKSSPAVLVPEGDVRNGWFHNPDFDPRQSDVPGAVLLGDRQLRFLREWAADWRGGSVMKAALSQTLFSTLATVPGGTLDDSVVPRLEILAAGQYPENDIPAADADSNGWPPAGRNCAIRELRRGFALHVAGDQHLGSTIQYGVDDWNDAGYAICVPSIANYFPRRWCPKEPGANQRPGAPRYTGEFLDGFGNHVTVHAVSNPRLTGGSRARLHEKAPGYGIVRFHKASRTMTLACWPRSVDPAGPGAAPYERWPVTISQADNYGRQPAGFLPALEVKGLTDPVIQVISEADGEVVYTLRIAGTRFAPKVFQPGLHTIKVGDPDLNTWKTLTGLDPGAELDGRTVEVLF